MTWPDQQVGFGMDHVRETSDGLRAELTVESTLPGASGRIAGPVTLNLLSVRSQTETTNKLAGRLNGTGPKLDWEQMVGSACAIVARQYRAPSPLIDLSTVEDAGPVEYLIPGVVPVEETTLLYGDGESAKSLLALRIGLSVCLGHPLPWQVAPTRICPVLYLDWETNPKTVAGRLRRLATAQELSVPTIHYRQCFRSLDDELPHIREEVSKLRIGLIIVDSIGFAASGALVEDETARRALAALRQMHPATRLVLAHVSSETAKQTSGPARPFGSAFFWNGMRSGIELRRSDEGPGGDCFELGMYHRKANDGEHHKPIGLRVIFDGSRGPIAFEPSSIDEVPDLAARTSLSSRLRGLLQQGARDTADIADELDVPVDTVSKTLRRMPDTVRLSEGGGRGKSARWGLADEAF